MGASAVPLGVSRTAECDEELQHDDQLDDGQNGEQARNGHQDPDDEGLFPHRLDEAPRSSLFGCGRLELLLQHDDDGAGNSSEEEDDETVTRGEGRRQGDRTR